MGQLQGRTTKTTLDRVEIVSNDAQQVMTITRNTDGVIHMRTRKSIENQWAEGEMFATIDPNEGKVLAIIFGGGDVSYNRTTVDAIPTDRFSLPAPEEIKDPMSGDCTPLDIERAKAANLQEERELVKLQMERDHSLDKHITADVQGCPACERKVVYAADAVRNPDSFTADAAIDDLPI